jgi:hypothetical protein
MAFKMNIFLAAWLQQLLVTSGNTETGLFCKLFLCAKCWGKQHFPPLELIKIIIILMHVCTLCNINPTASGFPHTC